MDPLVQLSEVLLHACLLLLSSRGVLPAAAWSCDAIDIAFITWEMTSCIGGSSILSLHAWILMVEGKRCLFGLALSCHNEKWKAASEVGL